MRGDNTIKLGKLIIAAISAVLLVGAIPTAFCADGWANIDGITTGGSGGETVVVTTLSQFASAVSGATPRIVIVKGMISIGGSTGVGSNKTIQGYDANSGWNGDLRGNNVTNIIIQNLNITNNVAGVGEGDGITFRGVTHYFVTHCTFTDCYDGEFDQTHACDYGTVSWCKFQYTLNTGHNFVNLIGHSDSNAAEDTGKLRITMHHNWYSSLCVERMPRVRFGKVHVYNSYFSSPQNSYCVGIGNNCQVLLESCYFEGQKQPWKNYSSAGNQGIIHWNNANAFVNSPVPTWASNSTVFSLPSGYTYDSYKANGADVKSVVMASAGVVSAPTNYKITASAGAGGSISPPGSITVASGTSKTFTITPNAGYGIVNLAVDGLRITPVINYTFSNVTANHTISVAFAKLVGANNKAVRSDANVVNKVVKTWGKVMSVNGTTSFTISDGYSSPVTVFANGVTLPTGFGVAKTVVVMGKINADKSISAQVFQ